MLNPDSENIACTVLLKTGRWSMLQIPNGSKGAYHHCLRFEDQFKHLARPIVSFPVVYCDKVSTKTSIRQVKPAWRCGACNKKAPKSIVALVTKEKK